MARVFEYLKPGDRIAIEGVRYTASGRMTLRTPDGSVWNEWLLVPQGMAPAEAIDRAQHRWLAREEGLTLWSPTALPTGCDPARVARGEFVSHEGRQYRAFERGEMRVEQVLGDVGGDAGPSEIFDYLDLRAGLSLLSIEWNVHGTCVYTGRRVGDHELVQWTNAAGNNLLARVPAAAKHRISPPRKSTSDLSTGSNTSGNIIAMVIFLPIIVLTVMLESCDGSRDCYQRVNPQTGQTETVCEDGVRNRYGRSAGGWGGK